MKAPAFFKTSFSANSPKITMRMQFLRWLFLCALAAFLASIVLSFQFEKHSSWREAQHMINTKITEADEHAQHARNTLARLKKLMAETGIRNASIVATMLKKDPSYIVPGDDEATTANLGKIGALLEINEIDVINEKGICVATWPPDATEIGYDYHDAFKAKEFLNIIDDPSLKISQEIRETEGSSMEGRFQFSAVARQDAPGFVEIGFMAKAVEDAYRLADLHRYVSDKVGKEGFLCVFENESKLSGPDLPEYKDLTPLECEKIQLKKFNSKSYLVYARKDGDLLFVGGIPEIELLYSHSLTLILLIASNFAIFLIVFLLISTLVQRLIVNSVYAVNRSLEKITSGDLGERVDVSVSKEFIELSNGVNATVDSLKQVVEEIKQRTQEELLLARKIQAAALPNLSDLFPDKSRFDVFAQNRPMSSVGGDMYDFFALDPDTLIFYVADVSGHGVPGALVMMKTMALVKNLALSGYDLDKVVSTTNRYLSENNDSSFVTGFFCRFNLKSGVLTYVNAGHNAPFIRRGDGVFEEFSPDINLILGIDPDAEYECSAVQLSPGDSFVLYTDGITEATTPAIVECFENHRALEALNGIERQSTAEKYVSHLFEAVDEFTNNAEPSDDETVLVFRFIAKSI